jgi:pyruvate dehydrogenase E1 component alpha subunit
MVEWLKLKSGSMLHILNMDGSLEDVPDTFPFTSDKELVKAYGFMVRARVADEWAISLNRQGRMPTYVPSIGQEANSVGAILALRKDDWFVQSYRELGGLLARGIPLSQVYQYWYGNELGSSYEAREYYTLPISVPVSSQTLHAVGIAYAERYLKSDRVVITYVGDGGTSEGDFHEAMNFAGNRNASVIFFVQNNQYAISMPRSRQTASKTLADKATAYGFEGLQVDGNDVVAVYAAVTYAAEKARHGGGPTLIEGVTYRLSAHTTSDDPNRYRDEAEVQKWRERDPILRLERLLVNRKLLSKKDAEEVKARAKDEAREQFRLIEEVPDPSPKDGFDHIFAEMPSQLQLQLKQRQELRQE